MKTCGIYGIKNIKSNKTYIGQSIHIENRFSGHKSKLRKCLHRNSHLQSSWNKYGEENFEFFIIEKCSVSRLTEREQFHLDSINKDYRYNKGNCVDCPARGVPISDSHKKSISEKLTGRKMDHDAVRRSAESRKGMTMAHKGRKQSKEHIEKRISKLRGRKINPGIVEKTAAKNRGKKRSKEQRQDMSKRFSGSSNPFYGKTHSEDARKNMSKTKRKNRVI